jgi:hypothetical protein
MARKEKAPPKRGLPSRKPLAPIEDAGDGAVPSSHLCRVRLDLMLARLHNTISRTWAAAAAPSVIGGPGIDFK